MRMCFENILLVRDEIKSAELCKVETTTTTQNKTMKNRYPQLEINRALSLVIPSNHTA